MEKEIEAKYMIVVTSKSLVTPSSIVEILPSDLYIKLQKFHRNHKALDQENHQSF